MRLKKYPDESKEAKESAAHAEEDTNLHNASLIHRNNAICTQSYQTTGCSSFFFPFMNKE